MKYAVSPFADPVQTLIFPLGHETAGHRRRGRSRPGQSLLHRASRCCQDPSATTTSFALGPSIASWCYGPYLQRSVLNIAAHSPRRGLQGALEGQYPSRAAICLLWRTTIYLLPSHHTAASTTSTTTSAFGRVVRQWCQCRGYCYSCYIPS